MIDMKLTRQYFDVKDVRFGDKCALENGVLTVNEAELQALTADLCKAVKGYHLEITKPGENARIIHVLDTIAPMVKIEGAVLRIFQHPLYRRPRRHQHAVRLCRNRECGPSMG